MCNVEELKALTEEVKGMRADMDKANGLLETIADQVAPVLESLKSSPILKMMGVK